MGCFLLLCRVADVKPTANRAFQWLRNYRIEFGERVRDVVGTLSEKKRTILILRYGLVAPDTKTLREIGSTKNFDVTRQRIQQLESKAIDALRHPT